MKLKKKTYKNIHAGYTRALLHNLLYILQQRHYLLQDNGSKSKRKTKNKKTKTKNKGTKRLHMQRFSTLQREGRKVGGREEDCRSGKEHGRLA